MFATDQSASPGYVARLAEDLGFHSLWFPEHSHMPSSRETPWGGVSGARPLPEQYWHTLDAPVALAHAAAVTNTIRLGTGVSLVAQRDPIWTAKEIATLDHLSGGRAYFGVGYGWNKEEMANHGTRYAERRTMLRDHVLTIKALWTEEDASYQGDHFRLEPSWAWPKPVQKPHPPIIMGAAAGPKTISHMVEFCDGWMPLATRHDIVEKTALVRDAVAASGRDPQSFEIIAYGTKTDDVEHLANAGIDHAVYTIPTADEETVSSRLHSLAETVGLRG